MGKLSCPICDSRYDFLQIHLLRKHKITEDEATKLYGITKFTSDDRVNKLTGENNPFYGKKHSLEMITNMILHRDGKEYKDTWQYCPVCKIRTYSDSTYCAEHTPLRMIGDKNPAKRPEVRAKIKSKLAKNTTRITNVIRASKTFPNDKEVYLINILESILPGCYQLNYPKGGKLVGNRHPDIISINNNKMIDMFGDYWHDANKFPNIMSEFDRIKFFKDHGYDLLIIWESELVDSNRVSLLTKIVNFHNDKRFNDCNRQISKENMVQSDPSSDIRSLGELEITKPIIRDGNKNDIPLFTTPTLITATDLKAQKGFLSSAAYKVINPGAFCHGTISGLS